MKLMIQYFFDGSACFEEAASTEYAVQSVDPK
jgi:hypothetical protein